MRSLIALWYIQQRWQLCVDIGGEDWDESWLNSLPDELEPSSTSQVLGDDEELDLLRAIIEVLYAEMESLEAAVSFWSSLDVF